MMNDTSNFSANNLSQSDLHLPSILSSLSSETSNSILLENVRATLGYILSFSISEVDEKLFQWIMPPIKTALQKAFDELVLMSDTCEEDFILDVLKDNLKFVCGLIEILRDILKFLVETSAFNLCYIKSVAVTSIEVISSTFDHCRKSSEAYKKNFNQDLVEIFKLIQEPHSLFFQLFETGVLVENNEDVEILLDVLDHLCITSDILHFLNVKSSVTNWKGYLAISQKFVGALSDQINLKKPLASLCQIINHNFSLFVDSESSTSELNSNRTKCLSFLVKVVLKLLDTFWDHKKKILEEIIQFCCMVYSFSTLRLLMLDYSIETVKLMDEMVFVQIKSLLARCLQEDSFIKAVINNKTLLQEKYAYGLLSLLNDCMECMVLSKQIDSSEFDVVCGVVFDTSKICFPELFWPESIFDSLVINMASVIMVNDKCFKKMEPLLLKNILQEEIWNYFLAVEVWCLVLRNATPQFCADTLTNLIRIYDQLQFGNNTYRLEQVYFKHLIQRVYELVPDYLKCQMSQSMYVHKKVWKIMDFHFVPKQMKYFVDEVYKETLQKFDEIGTEKFSCQDLFILGENLEMLSTVNLSDMCIESLNLSNSLEGIWESAFADTENKVFRYFIAKLFKITSSLTKEFNNKQLYTILNQLTPLSSDDSFKLQTSLLLGSICSLNSTQFGQDGCRIFAMISNIIINILRNSNNIIKQNVLELLDVCAHNGKQSVVRDVVMKSQDDQTLISDYLQKRFNKTKFDAEYFKMIGSFEYKHKCVEWKNSQNSKRMKLDENSILQEQNNLTELNITRNDISNDFKTDKINDDVQKIDLNKNDSKETIKYKLKEFKYKPYKKKKNIGDETKGEEDEEQEVDSVNDVIVRLKGEAKCLLNVLKTEKLSSKNVADLKIVTNQLMSLM